MARSKQKKQNVASKKKKTVIFIIIMACLILALALVFLNNHLKNIYSYNQRKNLEESVSVMSDVLSEFAESTPYQKSYDKWPSNSCTDVGAKYSTDYSCGNSFTLTVVQIDENQYRGLSQQLIDIYQSKDEFTKTKVDEPALSSDSKKITAIVGGSFKNTKAKCYVSSEYSLAEKVSTFNGGCNQVAKSLVYPRPN